MGIFMGGTLKILFFLIKNPNYSERFLKKIANANKIP
jgi:hypothetical protein